MKFALIAITFFAAAITLNEGSGAEFDYMVNGPDTWFIEYPDCALDMQSPINIKDYRARFDCGLLPLEFANFDQNITWNLDRTEEGLVLTVEDENLTPALYVGGSDFPSGFEVVNAHFHYGFNDFQGSEHTLNGAKFPMEMHIVTQDGSGNTRVFGFFFRIDERNNTALDSFIAGVDLLESAETTEIELNLLSILPADTDRYFRYAGSFTTPPCTQGVTWSVINAQIPISEFQMDSIHNLELQLNFRPVQPLNGRTIYSSWRINECAATD